MSENESESPCRTSRAILKLMRENELTVFRGSLIFGLEPTRSRCFYNKLFTLRRGYAIWRMVVRGRGGADRGRAERRERITGDETSGKEQKGPQHHQHNETERRAVNSDFQPSGFPLSPDTRLDSVNAGNGLVCISWLWFPSILLARTGQRREVRQTMEMQESRQERCASDNETSCWSKVRDSNEMKVSLERRRVDEDTWMKTMG